MDLNHKQPLKPLKGTRNISRLNVPAVSTYLHLLKKSELESYSKITVLVLDGKKELCKILQVSNSNSNDDTRFINIYHGTKAQ